MLLVPTVMTPALWQAEQWELCSPRSTTVIIIGETWPLASPFPLFHASPHLPLRQLDLT